MRSASNETTGATASYTYHPDGLRATRTAGGKDTRYVYLNGKVIEELDKNNQLQARNIWGNELLFRKDTAANKQGYYLYNGHGDVVKIVGEQGEELNRYEYDTWGNIVSKREGMSNPFAYSGEMFDSETGFYYLRARYYDPTVGRFISEDTYKGQVDNPLSLNRYTYVSNNPLRYVDPSGHKQCEGANNCDGDSKSRLHHIYLSTKDMDLSQALTILSSSGKFSEQVVQSAQRMVMLSVAGPDGGSKWFRNAKSSAQLAKYKGVLKTWQDANPLIANLMSKGKLPSNYITKDQARAYGWSEGKALGSWVKDIPNVQLGGDIFENRNGILPMIDGRVWYEADVGLVNTMGRNKQPGTRLLYSSDGQMYITVDHYENFYYIGNYFDTGNMT
ncbi:hypothetical protein NDK47_21140 [Brevibacillus ruminantium]|uniref:Ribonuclease n=1 Tax=Brevibacillus ruminantium TaxID=2950604 RepID=A0ABY4WH12_9BACL|nr:RHS repeat-associated core domain-containing protein [Brevibacillus ruminantium]USG64624.1 hypothetical protein NDK47_21140 [Brevibacillus ruminantium]